MRIFITATAVPQGEQTVWETPLILPTAMVCRREELSVRATQLILPTATACQRERQSIRATQHIITTATVCRREEYRDDLIRFTVAHACGLRHALRRMVRGETN